MIDELIDGHAELLGRRTEQTLCGKPSRAKPVLFAERVDARGGLACDLVALFRPCRATGLGVAAYRTSGA